MERGDRRVAGGLGLRLRLAQETSESAKINLEEISHHPAISAAISLLRRSAELSFLTEAKPRALPFFPKLGASKFLRKEAPSFVFPEQAMQAEECFAEL